MDFDEFKDKYSLTMMYYQTIEYDIKWIYSYMIDGNPNSQFNQIENITLGTMIRELEKLDNSDGHPYITKDDYQFLRDICDHRNHWAHQTFLEFMYLDNWINSEAYANECKKLKKDFNQVKTSAKILEDIRIDYVSEMKRQRGK